MRTWRAAIQRDHSRMRGQSVRLPPLTFILAAVSTTGPLSSEADTEFTVGLILWLERVNDPSAIVTVCRCAAP